MKILVFSDSHGNMSKVKKALQRHPDADRIFHLGDYISDAQKIEENVACPVTYVKGNIDFIDGPLEIEEDLCGKKFLLTHGHCYGIKGGLDRLYYSAQEKSVDVALFGHTHVPFQEVKSNILFFNPGSIGDKRWQPNETYGIIELTEDGKIDARIMKV